MSKAKSIIVKHRVFHNYSFMNMYTNGMPNYQITSPFRPAPLDLANDIIAELENAGVEVLQILKYEDNSYQVDARYTAEITLTLFVENKKGS